MSDLERFKNFYKNPNQEDYNYFKKNYIKNNLLLDTIDAIESLMNNLDFQDLGDGKIGIIENEIDFDSLHPLIQKMIKAYFAHIENIN